MLSLHQFLLFAPTALIIVVIPGPDFALLCKLVLTHGRKTGFGAALGFATGVSIHTTLAVLGLALVIQSSHTIYAAITILGALYLAYIGIGSLREAKHLRAITAETPTAVPPQTNGVNKDKFSLGFLQGLLCNMLNPKAIIYIMTLLPQFVENDRPIEPQLAALGAVLAGICVTWFMTFTTLLEHIRPWMETRRNQQILLVFCGVIFIGLSLRLAWSSLVG